MHFSVGIAALKETVWEVLLDDATYRQWTAVFAEGSYAEGDWSEGSMVRFLTPDRNGMLAVVEVHRPEDFISLKHIGYVLDGVDDTESEEVKAWAPAFENYTLTSTEDGAELAVDIDVLPEYQAFFEEVWPKALETLKRLAERA